MRLALAALAACLVVAPSALAADGDVDSGFGGGDGFQTHDCGFDDAARDVAVQTDGKIVVVGNATGANADFCVVRLNVDGSLDPGFGTSDINANMFNGDGDSRVTFGGDDLPFSVAIQPDGRIVIAGQTDAPSGGATDDFAILRLNANGTRDSSFHDIGAPTGFDGDGRVSINIDTADADGGGGTTNDIAREVIAEPNGNVFVAGDDGDDVATVRLTQAGNPDNAYGNGDGVRVTDLGGNDLGEGALLQPDGKYVVTGRSTAGGGVADNFGVVRLHPSGANDGNFGDGGANIHVDFGDDDEPDAVLRLPDARLLVAGETDVNEDMGFAMLTPAGLLDPSFDGDGKLGVDFGAAEDARDVALTVDGKIAAAGFTNGVPNPRNIAVAKFDPSTGSLDPAFSGDGKQIFDSGVDETGHGIARTSDGGLLLVGETDAGGGTISNLGVVKLADSLPVASIGDASAAEGASLAFPVTLSKSSGARVEVQFETSDDSALAGADYDGSAGILRLNPGEIQATVNVAARADGLIEPDERLLLNVSALGATLADATGDGLITNVLLPGACTNVLTGTAAAEVLNGTTAGDSLSALAGNDTVNGLGGNDCLAGGTGADTLNGAGGRDNLRGEASKDRLDGGPDKDRLDGGPSNDRLYGKAGNDTLGGSTGNDVLSGADGNDRLSGGAGNDRLSGGRGKNRYSGGAGNDVISAGNRRGNETVSCGSGRRDRATVDRTDKVSGCERVKVRR